MVTLFIEFVNIAVNSIEKSAISIINHKRQLLIGEGYKISKPVRQDYCYSVEILNNQEKLKLLVYFGKKGNKINLQGNKESNLYKEVYSIIFGEILFDEFVDEIEEPGEYIGTDESGKGDYFGPLVVAGVFVNKDSRFKLKELGVRDSKTISDEQIKYLAKGIKKVVGKGYETVLINPERYNQLYEKMGNLNQILGWAHSRVLENLLEKVNSPSAISDKFGSEKIIQTALMEKGRKLDLQQVTKAERFIAVASASILARNLVVGWFERQSKNLGIKLPKGASEEVERTAKTLKEKIGDDVLEQLAKLHFKITRRI